MRTISTTSQARWKDSCAPSAQVDLTVVANGEEPVQVFTPSTSTTPGLALVPAGIAPPTVAAVITDGGSGGLLPAGSYVYLYCYASSAYPNVEADTTAGGFLWPKSNPSPVPTVFTNTLNHKITVTVATTTRPDIDKILIYRNQNLGITAITYAQIVAQAGQLFFVGFVDNNPSVATVAFTDNVAATQEELEVDNFEPPQAWKAVYLDPYWYTGGNPDLIVPVTIDSSGGCTATDNAFFAGRNGQFVTFDGITTGGFDGQGTFYYLFNTMTDCYVSVSQDLSSQDFPGYVGTTTMRVRGIAGVIYRSKARNPFGWGYTEYQTSGDSQIRVTQPFAQQLGGYLVSIAVMPQQRLIKVDFERRPQCFVIDVSVPLETNFAQATRLLDSRYIVTAHDSQFLALLPGGDTALRGIDTSNFDIVQSDAGGQAPVSDPVFQTLRQMRTANDAGRQFHGVFDSQTELSAFWIKTANDPNGLLAIDTCLLFHGPSGQWSLLRDLDVTASCSVYDPVLLQNITLIGTASGQICQAFAPGVAQNVVSISAPVQNAAQYTVYTVLVNSAGSSLASQYFDIYQNPGAFDRFYFALSGVALTIPAQPTGCTLRQIFLPNPQFNSAVFVAGQIRVAMSAAGYTSTSVSSATVTATAPADGMLPANSAGTAPVTITQSTPSYATGTLQINSPVFPPTGLVGTWAMVYDANGQNEQWCRVSGALTGVSGGGAQFYTNAWLNPYTGLVSSYPIPSPPVGYTVRVGVINCEAQTYFQPSDTVSGQRVEIWATQDNVDTANQWARYYAEFDTNIYGAPFQLKQPTRGSGVPSNNWTTGSGIPTGLIPQFGIRFIERGYGAYVLSSFTLFGQAP